MLVLYQSQQLVQVCVFEETESQLKFGSCSCLTGFLLTVNF